MTKPYTLAKLKLFEQLGQLPAITEMLRRMYEHIKNRPSTEEFHMYIAGTLFSVEDRLRIKEWLLTDEQLLTDFEGIKNADN